MFSKQKMLGELIGGRGGTEQRNTSEINKHIHETNISLECTTQSSVISLDQVNFHDLDQQSL